MRQRLEYDMSGPRNNPESGRPAFEGTTCEAVQDALHMVLMDESDDDTSATVFLHLAGCPECRSALREHVEIAASLLALGR
jgi:hypothetical protein